uniref:SWIM-type domain-containing protein n=1 Tax=Plectus sambesii TaxID=2011161 RepID=A0A914WNH3_9BILA
MNSLTIALFLVVGVSIGLQPSDAVGYTNSCSCGHSYDGNNCAHYLTNWMIKNGWLSTSPGKSTANCRTGRPIRAKDVRKIFRDKYGAPTRYEPAGNSFIYVERKRDGKGHVYYGTKRTCVAGTGNGAFAGRDAVWEFYQ